MDPSKLSPVFITKFQSALLSWSQAHPRPMPWKAIKDPYLVWLSEIILQQTRVEQGWNYFLRFKAAYPSVEQLAKASEDEVLKLWQGLGYYSRARNLHSTAKIVTFEMDGIFPSQPQALQQLKGVGPYTAAAIAAFAFDYPAAVVDGNVYRIYARLFSIDAAIDTGAGKRMFQSLADILLDKDQPAAFNQALLDFGATHCKPKIPLCASCPFQSECKAYVNDEISKYPVKSKRMVRKDRYFNYLVLEHEGQILLRHRQAKDIWQGLYDFPLWEANGMAEIAEINDHFYQMGMVSRNTSGQLSPPSKQILTHQRIIGQFYTVKTAKKPMDYPENCQWVPIEEINRYAFPRIVDLFLSDRHLYLNLR